MLTWLIFTINTICLLFLCYHSMAINVPMKIVHAHVVFRHGDRTPIIELPGIPGYEKANWALGLGMLTETGIKGHFRLGRYLREHHYEEILGTRFHRDELWVRSSDLERTLMSAEAVLAGVFYSQSSHHWNPDLHWWPTPIHTVAQDKDQLLLAGECQRYKAIKTRLSNHLNSITSPEDHHIINLILSMVKFPSVDLNKASDVFDALYCGSQHKKPYPGWVTADVFKQLSSINDRVWAYYFSDNEYLRVRGGPLLHLILENMAAITAGKRPSLHANRMCMISAHDTNVMALMHILGFKGFPQPPYGSTVLLELLVPLDFKMPTNITSSSLESWHVRLLYRNSSGSAVPLVLPGCDDVMCPYPRFLQLHAPNALSPAQYHTFCRNNDIISMAASGEEMQESLLNRGMIGWLVAGLVLLLLIFIMAFLYLRSMDDRKYSPYHRVAQTELLPVG